MMSSPDYDPTEDDRWPRCGCCNKVLDRHNLTECATCRKPGCERCLSYSEGPREYHCTDCLAATFSTTKE